MASKIWCSVYSRRDLLGFYFRVLEEGYVDPRPVLKRLSRGKESISVWYANEVKYRDSGNLSAIEEILREEALSESWRSPSLKKGQAH
ncbi:3-alpha domain-containing protein [Bacillus velezensis]